MASCIQPIMLDCHSSLTSLGVPRRLIQSSLSDPTAQPFASMYTDLLTKWRAKEAEEAEDIGDVCSFLHIKLNSCLAIGGSS